MADADGDDEAKAEDGEKPAAGGRAAAIKAWSDAVSALMKAALLGLAVAGVLVVGGVAVWREQGRHTIAVDVDPGADKLLRDRGTDIDLRATLIDDLNGDISAVESFVRTTLFNTAALTGSREPLSLKPFGLDATTGDVGGLYRAVFGAAEPLRVRFEMLCAAGGCDATKPGYDPKRDLTLLVEVQADERARRLSFRVPASDPGLRRGLRAALRSASEALLEQIDPLLASLLYFNAPESSPFLDERQRYGRLAVGASALVKADAPARSCMAEIVYYGSAASRTLEPSGLDAVEKVAERAGVAPTCRSAGKTTAALMRVQFATCWLYDPPGRRAQLDLAQTEMEGLDELARQVDDVERDGIRQRQLAMQAWFAVNAAIDATGTAPRFCGGQTPEWDGKLTPFDISAFQVVAAKTMEVFDPARKLVQTHPLAELFNVGFQTIPRGALVERERWSQTIAKLASAYIPGDPAPRQLLMARGEALMQGALGFLDALRLSDPDRSRLLASLGFDDTESRDDLLSLAWAEVKLARIAFDNASATTGASSLAESGEKLAPLLASADAAWVGGIWSDAKSAYARVVQGFVEADEPPDAVFDVADAAARWLAVSMQGGRCLPGAPRDLQWDKAWSPLGVAPGFDPCSLARDQAPTAAKDDPLAPDPGGLLTFLRPLIAGQLQKCPRGPPSTPGFAQADAESGRQLACMRGVSGVGPAKAAFLAVNTRASVDDAIERAIAAP